MSVIRLWVLPITAMLIAAGTIGAVLGATNAGLLAYYLSLGLLTVPCAVYVVWGVGREEHPEPFRRAWRRARESRRHG